ncbi:ATP-grasp domain-containing protein [Corynebacterium sp. ZY180755]
MANTLRGWLVVNGFVHTPKFEELHQWLLRSAREQGVDLELKTNVDLHGKLEWGDHPDFALFWDKDVKLCKRIESEGIPTFNNARAIELCDDKAKTYLALKEAAPHITQPLTLITPHTFRGVSWAGTAFVSDAISSLGLPLVAKEAFGSFGAQVHLINSEVELVAFLDQLETRPALLQEYVEATHGQDTRLQVVGGEVVAAIKRTAHDGDFRANLTNGGTAQPYQPTPEEVAMAVDTCEALGLTFAGVDLLFGAEGPVLCEVNSNAHFVNLSRSTGVNVGAKIIQHVVNEVGM